MVVVARGDERLLCAERGKRLLASVLVYTHLPNKASGFYVVFWLFDCRAKSPSTTWQRAVRGLPQPRPRAGARPAPLASSECHLDWLEKVDPTW